MMMFPIIVVSGIVTKRFPILQWWMLGTLMESGKCRSHTKMEAVPDELVCWETQNNHFSMYVHGTEFWDDLLINWKGTEQVNVSYHRGCCCPSLIIIDHSCDICLRRRRGVLVSARPYCPFRLRWRPRRWWGQHRCLLQDLAAAITSRMRACIAELNLGRYCYFLPTIRFVYQRRDYSYVRWWIKYLGARSNSYNIPK